jgi:tryptophanyl-tRNA synthetase
MKYYQEEYNANLFIPIADLEALAVRKTEKADVRRILTEFLCHIMAAGIQLNVCKIYLQTSNARALARSLLYAGRITMAELTNIYRREMELGEAVSSLVMASDIADPHRDGMESIPVILGIDEINHFYLAKELIRRMESDCPVVAITYHRMITGLSGSKMGKSLPLNSVRLNETPSSLRQKLSETLPLQSLDGNWAWDVVAWFADDDVIKQIGATPDPREAALIAHSKACELLPGLLDAHQQSVRRAEGIASAVAAKMLAESGSY